MKFCEKFCEIEKFGEILRKRNHVTPIEIINNTRGGIVISLQSKKGNAAIGGQKIKMLK